MAQGISFPGSRTARRSSCSTTATEAGRTIRADLLTAVLRRPAVPPLAMATGTRRAQDLGSGDHLVLIFGLRRFVRLHAGVTNVLHELLPGRILRRSRHAVGTLSSRDQ